MIELLLFVYNENLYCFSRIKWKGDNTIYGPTKRDSRYFPDRILRWHREKICRMHNSPLHPERKK